MAGRPTSYKPEYAEQAVALCRLGATDIDLANFFDVSDRTILRWQTQHEEFCHALKLGKDESDDRVERSLYHRAVGFRYLEKQAIKVKEVLYGKGGKRLSEKDRIEIVEIERAMPPDTTAGIFWLKNRRRDAWREKQPDDVPEANGETVGAAPQDPGLDRLKDIGQRYGNGLKVIEGGQKAGAGGGNGSTPPRSANGANGKGRDA